MRRDIGNGKLWIGTSCINARRTLSLFLTLAGSMETGGHLFCFVP
jgi:hypothetical protein